MQTKRPRGRPAGWRAENPRVADIRVKLTPEEKEDIRRAAELTGETMSEYVRTATRMRGDG